MTRPDVLAFAEWSPLQLAHALGYRIDLRTVGGGQRDAFLIGPHGRERPTGHSHAWAILARLALWRGLDPAAPPHQSPRALINGQPQ